MNLFYSMKQRNYLILPTQRIKFRYYANGQLCINLFVLVVVLLILAKRSALYGKGQKNMPTKVIIKNKVPFMNTCWHGNITTISLIYLMLIIIPSTTTSLIIVKLEITQLLLINQITGTFYFSWKHTWLKRIDHP